MVTWTYLSDFVQQGDNYDSSDEEWDLHIGSHARAFLGLDEPVAEIALDEGVGIGMMVRNALARAEEIHIQASVPGSPSNDDPNDSPADTDMFECQVAVDADNMNVSSRDLEVGNCHSMQMHGSAADLDMQSNYSASLEAESSAGGNCSNEDSSSDGSGDGHRGASADPDLCGSESDGGPEENSNDTSSDGSWDASDGTASDGEDVEELLGQIPRDRMGSDPEFDIAATLPLYEGSTLSMLCATLLIVNCCKTHGVSNMFMNELLMLLSMTILPMGNCLPKTEYEASKILRKLGLAYNMIHACPNGCCLFKGDLEDSEQCPVCEHARYRMCGRSRVPSLILRHFPRVHPTVAKNV